MSVSRFSALDTILNRDTPEIEAPAASIASFFGCNVFGDEAMKSYMTEDTYLSVKKTIQSGQKLSRVVADQVAEAMKNWAMAKGATHYSHWFQPLTGRTAEKHDSFFTLTPSGQVIEEFSGEALVQQEPDGSSFPGGGLRSTFEARGYTAWDPSSPSFILEVGEGKTLCIPTILTTYSGEALDYKLPLLRSQAYLEATAIEVCKMFDDKVTRVSPTLGWEQEYFLVDEALFRARPDLFHCGRCLVGTSSAKGQQLEDHYFGSIPERVYAFMRDLETECHKLGIPVRTRHNEVAPAQYELAPMFEEVNIAVDHNQLLMDIMDRVARRHKLAVLLYEKPFDFINGSGKHNNWSMGTDTGKNLLSPGKDPINNLQFLTFFVNVIRAVHSHADVLRASVASSGNDHRLGANEAPPAIVSVFIGEGMTRILDAVEKATAVKFDDMTTEIDLLAKIPTLEIHNTDRNRTSPFAFTGNKFEIRMVGSTANCAAPMTVMNTIMAAQLAEYKIEVDKLMAEGKTQEDAMLTVIRRYITESRPVLFEGDNYSDEWRKEAERRGLPNVPNTALALDAYVSEKSKALFLNSGVMSDRELQAHHAVKVEKFSKEIHIEAELIREMVLTQVIPAAVDYQNVLLQNVVSLKELNLDEATYETQLELIKMISHNINGARKAINSLDKDLHKAEKAGNPRDEAVAYGTKVRPNFEEIRKHVDALENLVDDHNWPLPKMRELLFVR